MSGQVQFDKNCFGRGRTIMAELPAAAAYNGPLIFNPNPKDIVVLVPRRWRWLNRIFGERIVTLRAGRSLTVTSNGKRWTIDN